MGLILDSPTQRKRVMKVQDLVQKWCATVADPEIKARRAKGAPPSQMIHIAGSSENSLLAQARDLLQSLQDEEQISLNRRMHDQEWALQSTQILDFLPKLDGKSSSASAVEKDKARDLGLALLGWERLRFTERAIDGRLRVCVAMVRAVLDLRRAMTYPPAA